MNSKFLFLTHLFLIIISSGWFESFERNPTIIGTHCESFHNCSQNQFCFNNSCQCEPNYKYNFINDSCEPFKCNFDEDCDQFDRVLENVNIIIVNAKNIILSIQIPNFVT
jgi:hypothetical protein